MKPWQTYFGARDKQNSFAFLSELIRSNRMLGCTTPSRTILSSWNEHAHCSAHAWANPEHKWNWKLCICMIVYFRRFICVCSCMATVLMHMLKCFVVVLALRRSKSSRYWHIHGIRMLLNCSGCDSTTCFRRENTKVKVRSRSCAK